MISWFIKLLRVAVIKRQLMALVKRLRMALIQRQLRRVEGQQREALDDLVFAVDHRLYAQREFFERSKFNADRRETLQSELDAITTETTK